MVQPRVSKRPPSGKSVFGCHRNGGLLPASREVSQLRNLLYSKFSANEAAFEVLRGLGTPVQAVFGKRYVVVSAERQPTLFEVLRSLDFKVDAGTAGKGATMTVEDAANKENVHAGNRSTSYEGLRGKMASVPQTRESSRAPSPASHFGVAPAAQRCESSGAPSAAPVSGPSKFQQASGRPSSARPQSVNVGIVNSDRRPRPSSARPASANRRGRSVSERPASAKQDCFEPARGFVQPTSVDRFGNVAEPGDVQKQSSRPASAKQDCFEPARGFAEAGDVQKQSSRPASARQAPLRNNSPDTDVDGSRPRRPLSARIAQSHGNHVIANPGPTPTLMDVLGLPQKSSRPSFVPPRPTSAPRSSSEQRAASERLAVPRPRSARSGSHIDDSAKAMAADKEQDPTRRRARLLAEARHEDAVRRRAGYHPDSRSWQENAARRWPAMHNGSRQDCQTQKGCASSKNAEESSQRTLVREDEADDPSIVYKPGSWHHSIDDPKVFEDELKALQARVDARVSAARKSAPCVSAEEDSPSNGRPRRFDPRPSSALLPGGLQVRPDDADFQATEKIPMLVPQAVELPSMSIQPPELLESQEPGNETRPIGNETQPTQSLCYSRSLLSETARGHFSNSVIDALESKGEHNRGKDDDYDCTMLVLERALTGGA